jgi:type I restriction-modification system DNA methylase subunit
MSNTPELILQLVETFDRNIDNFKSQTYHEAQVRQQFINPFFEALGWDMQNKAGIALAYSDVIHEDVIKVGGATKAPDYCFRIGGTRKFFLEAKKPSVDIKSDVSPAYQLRRYAWSAKLPLSILTDFEEFAIYDCQIRPNINDKPSTARIFFCGYKEYGDKWEQIANIFSKEAVLKGLFDKYASEKTSKRGTTTVDKEFLAEIEGWRDELAKNIAIRNSKLSVYDLNFAVQKTIDRILFLRICEDRGIERSEQLLGLINGSRIYPRLFELFEKSDERYNSGIFHFRREKDRPESPDELSANLKIDDDVLTQILKDLYYPHSPYEFSVMPAEILGNVYEQFLGKVIRLTASHQAKVEEKPEVKKAGGVYYTPSYIVDYIVKNTVGKLCEGKTPKQIEKLKILDPACGSGSFLIGAYQCLLDFHRDYYAKSPAKYRKQVYQGRGGQWFLTIDEKKKILLNNIYGVDIDSQAVEVTKLSLLLKVLENETQESLRLFHERALPDLGNNIKCGNSLIGYDFYQNQQLSLYGEEEKYKINAFDWQAGFPEIFKLGGFDAVIGNPPYIFTRELITDVEKSYYYEKYRCTQFKINTYFLFVEKSFHLLNNTGMLGYITPNNWLSLEYSSEFRHFLLTSTFNINITNILNRVFQNASVDTCILLFGKSGKKHVIVHEMLNGSIRKIYDCPSNKYLANVNHVISYSVDSFNKIELCRKMSIKSIRLDRISEVKNGVQAYTVGEGTPNQTKEMKNNRVYHSLTKKDDAWIKYLDGVDVKRYFVGWSKQFIKYGNNLSRPRKPDLFNGERLLVRQIPSKPPYSILSCYVTEPLINDNNSMIVKKIAGERYDIKYIMGILTSKLMTFWFISTFAKLQRKVFPQFKIKELSQFPIFKINFNNPDEKQRHDKMVSLVEQMLDLHKKLTTAKTPDEKTRFQRQIDTTDSQIDKLVYDLYNLTTKEIEIIEGMYQQK